MNNSTQSAIGAQITQDSLRKIIRQNRLIDEKTALINLNNIDTSQVLQRDIISHKTAQIIREIRQTKSPDLLSLFVDEYNLNSEEGLALMTLAEALLRVPDNATRDKLFSDKITNKNWNKHLSTSNSALVFIATLSLNIAEKLVREGHDKSTISKIKKAIQVLSKPTMRVSASSMMAFFGNQFVFAKTIQSAIQTNKTNLYSFDMLGESAYSTVDAEHYFLSYENAIKTIGKNNQEQDIYKANGISVKLSALHPKYDFMHKQRVMNELVPKLLKLVQMAQSYNIAINIDAEECERLDISLDVIEAIAKQIQNTQWKGFGVVIQAYQKRAPFVLDWLEALTQKYNIKMMARLVKGAYWDAEIKKSQVKGEQDYPVYSKKANTDYSYFVCAQKLLSMRCAIYPQFASHNAHTLLSIYELSGDDKSGFEIQRLHGMGSALHDLLAEKLKIPSRIYAPVGIYKDLLAYLVRRLLENGANSSFINHLFNKEIPPERLAEDIHDKVFNAKQFYNPKILNPALIYEPYRTNSNGLAIHEPEIVENLQTQISPWLTQQWHIQSIVDNTAYKPQIETTNKSLSKILSPQNFNDLVGTMCSLNKKYCIDVINTASKSVKNDAEPDFSQNAQSLIKAAKLFEKNKFELMAIAIREAGKTYQDAIDEVREAIDFLNYYANQIQGIKSKQRHPIGVFLCISPWNFPLAIFTGQIAAALICGNSVIAKPSESTSIIAFRAIQLLHQAGISKQALQLVLGSGKTIGNTLLQSQLINGVSFTGSTQIAKHIKKTLVKNNNATARLIAETGGLNCMIVDSTALPEQVARDVVESAFKSAGQRCSALRILLVQEEISQHIVQIIANAMQEISLGDPKLLQTDCGPIINKASFDKLNRYIASCEAKGLVVAKLKHSFDTNNSNYVSPTIVKLNSITEINEEFFGPILHIVSYKEKELIQTIDLINAKGYGLTFGMHSRIDTKINTVVTKIKAGNLYINRNQIGAIVGSQPFGGEGLSGTGPKAGGLNTLLAYSKKGSSQQSKPFVFGDDKNYAAQIQSIKDIKQDKAQQRFCIAGMACLDKIQASLPEMHLKPLINIARYIEHYQQKYDMPSPTGETNILEYHPKGTVLCLGPSTQDTITQIIIACALGNQVITHLTNEYYQHILAFTAKNQIINLATPMCKKTILGDYYQAIMCFSAVADIEKSLLTITREIIPVIDNIDDYWRLVSEKLITTDTTASGGNANLLSLQ